MAELLSPEEARVLGCLLEKEAATPEYYPLTLNALRHACNQSSSRYPVVSYDDGDISRALASLREKTLIRIVYSQSNRAAKYRHVLDEVLGLDLEERAVLCLLLLRGPQTAGELRTRSERLARFESLEAVDAVLTRLAQRDDPLVARLPRAPGQKEARNRQLLAPETAPGTEPAGTEPTGQDETARTETRAVPGPAQPSPTDEAGDLRLELEAVRAEVTTLRSELEELRRRVELQ
jgi:uncharacterized protein